ncbi:Asp23/Gls24 family envelope stress response protein [Kribbella italica]|uniref:Putative alkaline shock family protein YloU n=1 Tax=Kribbella italica TaxID=1540520 RepID=A0A7W9JEH2_9ACTN|nr:putative alkaline shock family protein YloU [Kribbella italica]
MADTTTLPAPAARGRLEIAPKAIEKLAERAALDVAAVIHRGTTFGRGLPKATSNTVGSRVRITLQLAVLWGRPLPEIAAETRAHVATTVAGLTGLAVDLVDVEITAVLPRSLP